MTLSEGESLPRCGPPGVNEAAQAMVAPAASGLGVRTPRPSNLDRSRVRVVSKGLLVDTRDGFRYRVKRVRLGTAYLALVDAFGREQSLIRRYEPCSALWVVA